MQSLRMKAEALPELIRGLAAFGTVWAPVEKAPGTFTLEAVGDDPARARPDALRTILPFKKLLLKPEFTMLTRSADGRVAASEDNDRGPMVFFGAHACDVHALRILDMLYLSDYADPFYRRNRERLTVVGHGCMPDAKCFCESMGTSHVDETFDLFLNPLEGCYLVTVRSARGDDIVRANASLFQPVTRADIRAYLERVERRQRAFTLALDVSDLPYVLELKKDDPVWEELAKRCLCCGSCCYCGSCSCFAPSCGEYCAKARACS